MSTATTATETPAEHEDTWAIRAQRRREAEIAQADAATGAAFNSSL